MRQKAFMFMPFIAIFGVSIIFFALFLKVQEKEDRIMAKELGEQQFELLQTYQRGEKALLYVDQSARYSMYLAVYDMLEKGGLAGSECGELDGYSLWRYADKDCTPDEDSIKKNFALFFNRHMDGYLGVYREEGIPLDNYDYEVSLDSIKIRGIAIKNIELKVELPDYEKYGYSFPEEELPEQPEENPAETALPESPTYAAGRFKCAAVKSDYENLLKGIRQNYGDKIESSSSVNGVDAALITAVIVQESEGETQAVSSAGAAGLMQMMPCTAKEAGLMVSPAAYSWPSGGTCANTKSCTSSNRGGCDFSSDERFNADKVIGAGSKYLRTLLNRFDNNGMTDYEAFAVGSYNQGPGNIDKAIAASGKSDPSWEDVSPFATKTARDYVSCVLFYKGEYQRLFEHQTVSSGSTSVSSDNVFDVWPVADSYTITSCYGCRPLSGSTAGRACKSGYTDWHEGVDIKGVEGQIVQSVAAGKIDSICDSDRQGCGDSGTNIVIKHTIGNDVYYTKYLHLDSIYSVGISVGADVQAGQKIGFVGVTGKSTGAHLDFRVKKGSVDKDPFCLFSSDILQKIRFSSDSDSCIEEKTSFGADPSLGLCSEQNPEYLGLASSTSKITGSAVLMAQPKDSADSAGQEPQMASEQGGEVITNIIDMGKGVNGIYAVRPSFKAEISYDIKSRFEKYASDVFQTDKIVRECFVEGSGSADDIDVDTCGEKAKEQYASLVSFDEVDGEYHLFFKVEEKAPEDFLIRKPMTAMFAIAPKDDISPPAITGVKVTQDRVMTWEKSFASDAVSYDIFCSESQVQSTDEMKRVISIEREKVEENPIYSLANCGSAEEDENPLSADKIYYFAVVAVDESGNYLHQVTPITWG